MYQQIELKVLMAPMESVQDYMDPREEVIKVLVEELLKLEVT